MNLPSMALPPLTYVTTDSLSEGVGTSQVMPYVERLARRGVEVVVHSFEKAAPATASEERMARANVRWCPHRFGASGSWGGLARVVRAVRFLRGTELVHARSDLAAAAASIDPRRPWVWDMRAFFTDERVDLGMLQRGSPEERVLRMVERRLAHTSSAVVTLAAAAIPVLAQRHGPQVTSKCHVIPTCVDLDRFRPAPWPPAPPVTFLLMGTLNRLYDVPAMMALVDEARTRSPVALTVLTPATSPWDALMAAAGAVRRHASPGEMPCHITTCHFGLSVRRPGVVSLQAAVPTKLGEFLAAGRPVVVNPGLGDMDALIAEYGCGVMLENGSKAACRRALDRVEALLHDPVTPERCRAAAEAHFDLERAVDRLTEIYRGVTERPD